MANMTFRSTDAAGNRSEEIRLYEDSCCAYCGASCKDMKGIKVFTTTGVLVSCDACGHCGFAKRAAERSTSRPPLCRRMDEAFSAGLAPLNPSSAEQDNNLSSRQATPSNIEHSSPFQRKTTSESKSSDRRRPRNRHAQDSSLLDLSSAEQNNGLSRRQATPSNPSEPHRNSTESCQTRQPTQDLFNDDTFRCLNLDEHS
jgi:hypothetical protein